MNWPKVAKGAAVFALLSSPMPAGAMEIVGGSSPAGQMNDGMIQIVRHVHRGPAGRAHVNRNMNVKRNVSANRNVHVNGYRPGYHPGHRPAYRPPAVVGSWARPGWYRWAPGGAIAAGVAIGFVSAAAVAAWAPPPPGPGLCWYYTDPSQRDGFWDVCP